MLPWVCGYLAVVNLLDFALCWRDKRQARTGGWRVRERTLLGLAALGGSIGLLCGMRLFHHKTRHRSFSWGVPLMLAAQCAAAWYLLIR